MERFWRESRKVVQKVMGPKHLSQNNSTGSTAASVAVNRNFRLVKTDLDALNRAFQSRSRALNQQRNGTGFRRARGAER